MMGIMLRSVLLLISIVGYLDICWCETPPIAVVEEVSTVEPDAAPGCNAPDIRFTKPRKMGSTTEQPFAEFETTQIYLPEDFTTSDIEFVEKIDIDLSGHVPGEDTASIINPYQIDLGGSNGNGAGVIGLGMVRDKAAIHETDGEITDGNKRNINNNQRNRNKKRRSGGRRRQPHENGQNGRSEHGRGSRYKRDVRTHDGIIVDIGKWNDSPPASNGDIYYVEIADLLESKSLHKSLKKKLHKLKKPKKKENQISTKSDRHFDSPHDIEAQNRRRRRDANDQSEINFSSTNETYAIDDEHQIGDKGDRNKHNDSLYTNSSSMIAGDDNNLQRVKRKSGKTTGALSRPKGGGDSSSKSTSRKGEKAGVEDNDGTGYAIVHPEEEEVEESSEEEDEDAHTHFGDVTEIRFPGEVGPLGDHRLCKIRCVKGKWVGPLCATNEQDEYGNTKFTPLYKSCHVNRIPPHLLLSYRNISVNVGWDLPHGHSLQARCKDLGLYKLLGESRVLCSNGLWAPRMPSCVPTTLLTNFSDDSPPSIKIKIGTGSGAFEPSGVLAVLPGSTIHLDCMYPRRRGTPEWTWTSWYMQYYTDRDHLQSIEHEMTSRFRSMSALKRTKSEGWSSVPDERSTKYRLTIKDIQNSDSGTFTCASPRGLTNSIPIIVATSQCPQLPEPAAPLSLRLEGNKLGQRALYRCPLGYTIEGTINSTCLASGNWSSPPPSCQSVQCPPLYLEDSHLSLTELNTSAWGRAVFKCQWGFKLNGPPGLECEPNGVWSGPVPRCRAIQCPTPLVPLNGRTDGTSGSSSSRRYAVGALVTFSCNEGHILVGEASIVCTETGFWSHPPPFCKSQCPYPGDPPNGLIAPLKFHYDPGDFLSVQCRPGFVEYSPSGPPERPKCSPDGHWSGPVPQCRSYEEV